MSTQNAPPGSPSPEQIHKAQPLFQDLTKFLAIRDYKQVLKVANKLLHTDGFRTNYRLAKCKCSALIKMSNYNEVVKFIDTLASNHQSSFQDLAARLAYEKSYSLYRLFKNNEALTALKALKIETPEDQHKMNELQAQILYRLEQFDEAKNLYKGLLKNVDDDFSEDRENNLLACEAAMSMKNSVVRENLGAETAAEKVKVTKLYTLSPDASFNRAIFHLGNGDLVKAEKALITAKDELESYDDLEPEELEADLQPILLQLNLINLYKNKNQEAQKNYQTALKKAGQNLLTNSIINNNMIAVNQTHNLFDSKKRTKALQTKNTDLLNKLQSCQIFTMELNKVLVNVNAGALPVAREQLEGLKNLVENEAKFQIYAQNTDLILAEVALLVKEEKTEAAIQMLAEKSKNSEKLNLVLLQLQNEFKNLPGSIANTPGLLALNLAVAGSESEKLGILQAAEASYEAEKVSNPEKYKLFCQIFAEKLVGQNDQKAMQYYQFLANQDEAFLPKFIQISSKVDPAASKLAANKLESTDKLIEGVDINLLEETAGVAGSRYARKIKEQAGNAAAGDAKNSEQKVSRKRKRKPRLPKDLNKPIDNERWLPLKDRSYYRGRKAMKNKKTNRMIGAQGNADYGKNTMQLDASSSAFQGNKNSQAKSSGKSSGGKKKKRKR